MSVQAISWVLEHSQSAGAERNVLIAIANHVDRDTGEGWVYIEQVCREASCSIKTYRRAVQRAERNGELQRDVKAGNAPRAAGNHKPNLFRLPHYQTLPRCHPPKAETLPNGNGLDPPKMTPPRPARPSQDGRPEPLVTTEPSLGAVTFRAPRFDEFYDAYPRHVGRRAAEKAWNSARKRADPAVIVAAAAAFAAMRNGHDPQYTPYPATWLNRDQWLDPPDESVVLSKSAHTVKRWLERTENHDPTRSSQAHGNDGGRLFPPVD